MKCYECGNETIVRNDYHIDDEYIGQYIVKCEYNYCKNCNSEYIPFDSLEILETFENNKKVELLKKNFPIETNEYLTVEEIVRLAKLSGRWTQFFDGIDWDHPKLICWQRDAQLVDDKLEQLINDFMDSYK